MKSNIVSKFVVWILCFGFLTTVPMLVQAQEADTEDRWKFKLAIYLWGAGVGGTSIPANADVEVKGLVANLQGARTVLDVERATVDVLVGARYLDAESTLTLSPGAAGPRPSASDSASVWDGIIGVKGGVNITPKWYLPYYLDVGTGQSDLTWQALGGIGYRFKWVDLVLAYRHIQWDFKSDSAFKDMSFSGPALGGVFKF